MVKSCVCGFTPKGGCAALSNHLNKCKVLLARREAAATHNIATQAAAAAAAAPTEDPGPMNLLPAKGKNKRVASDEGDYAAETPDNNAKTAESKKRKQETETVEADTLARVLAAAQFHQVTELQKQPAALKAEKNALISRIKEMEAAAAAVAIKLRPPPAPAFFHPNIPHHQYQHTDPSLTFHAGSSYPPAKYSGFHRQNAFNHFSPELVPQSYGNFSVDYSSYQDSGSYHPAEYGGYSELTTEDMNMNAAY
ncbi:hypothetical protein R3P38DRAFT_3254698 [Favolaschia claudopus]|uniref:Uncharacterized protein n=1 Tax=Favolaschia claudopus TaxID=2862362 RepID=A0AAW0DNY8_9AGAR